ncbi:hypothetical protein BHE74_00034306 [Ensete ventricosum]|nr:hypothetical protein GW17_00021876 [Ensete ventricosum]RWW58798.1 hypothetical protein BHE74_00034306 [Ensete ventricosum]
MKSGGGVGNRSTASQTTDVFASVVAIESLAEKHPNVDEGLSLRKRSWKETFEPLADASGSTTRVPSGKGKEPMAIEEAPELGYTLRVLCEVEDHMGAEKYFATIMTWMKVAEGEDPLMPRWSTIAGSSQILALRAANKELKGRADQDLVTIVESRAKEPEGDVNKLWGELESLKTQWRRLEKEVGIIRSSLDGA